jgi:hypothetical protein
VPLMGFVVVLLYAAFADHKERVYEK